MFNLNFIAEPGMQKKSTNLSWSYIHKRKQKLDDLKKPIKEIKLDDKKSNIKNYLYAFCIILFVIGLYFYSNKEKVIGSDMVLNHVVDLIIESGYMKNLNLSEAHFKPTLVEVTIASSELNSIQNFTHGYRREDQIPYEIYQKNNKNYVSLKFPWDGGKSGGTIEILQSLANRTVFSNKISINSTKDEFNLKGRSSDIISYILQMADNNLIQKFNLSVFNLESGGFILRVKADQT
tara:strand:+ start:3629 stop:4333 length:705 start_codon:yes stop_codon:yes gene_type:complete